MKEVKKIKRNPVLHRKERHDWKKKIIMVLLLVQLRMGEVTALFWVWRQVLVCSPWEISTANSLWFLTLSISWDLGAGVSQAARLAGSSGAETSSQAPEVDPEGRQEEKEKALFFFSSPVLLFLSEQLKKLHKLTLRCHILMSIWGLPCFRTPRVEANQHTLKNKKKHDESAPLHKIKAPQQSGRRLSSDNLQWIQYLFPFHGPLLTTWKDDLSKCQLIHFAPDQRRIQSGSCLLTGDDDSSNGN